METHLPLGTGRQWRRLPIEVVWALSSEVFMTPLDKPLNRLILLRGDFVLSGRLDYRPPEVPSHPSDSVNLKVLC